MTTKRNREYVWNSGDSLGACLDVSMPDVNSEQTVVIIIA